MLARVCYERFKAVWAAAYRKKNNGDKLHRPNFVYCFCSGHSMYAKSNIYKFKIVELIFYLALIVDFNLTYTYH